MSERLWRLMDEMTPDTDQPRCGGTGHLTDASDSISRDCPGCEDCQPRCGGTGVVITRKPNRPYTVMGPRTIPCPGCPDCRCPTCGSDDPERYGPACLGPRDPDPFHQPDPADLDFSSEDYRREQLEREPADPPTSGPQSRSEGTGAGSAPSPPSSGMSPPDADREVADSGGTPADPPTGGEEPRRWTMKAKARGGLPAGVGGGGRLEPGEEIEIVEARFYDAAEAEATALRERLDEVRLARDIQTERADENAAERDALRERVAELEAALARLVTDAINAHPHTATSHQPPLAKGIREARAALSPGEGE